MILTYLVVVNGFIGMITFKPKFLEQVYGQSASKAIFLIGTDQRGQPWLRLEHTKPPETMMLLKGSVIPGDKVDLNWKHRGSPLLLLLSVCPVEKHSGLYLAFYDCLPAWLALFLLFLFTLNYYIKHHKSINNWLPDTTSWVHNWLTVSYLAQLLTLVLECKVEYFLKDPYYAQIHFTNVF